MQSVFWYPLHANLNICNGLTDITKYSIMKPCDASVVNIVTNILGCEPTALLGALVVTHAKPFDTYLLTT